MNTWKITQPIGLVRIRYDLCRVGNYNTSNNINADRDRQMNGESKYGRVFLFFNAGQLGISVSHTPEYDRNAGVITFFHYVWKRKDVRGSIKAGLMGLSHIAPDDWVHKRDNR